MIDVSLYSTEPGSKRVTVCIQDFEVVVLIVAQLHKAAEAALDKSDYGKLSKLALQNPRIAIMNFNKTTSNNAGYTRPKEAITYHFGSTGECWVSAYPQQTWEFCKHGSNMEIFSDKHHITLQIPIDDFNRHWVIKNKKEGGKNDKKRVDSSN